jgi:isopentenyldiphosphate isomerase
MVSFTFNSLIFAAVSIMGTGQNLPTVSSVWSVFIYLILHQNMSKSQPKINHFVENTLRFLYIESMEIFNILNNDGKPVGTATREECHNGSFLMHGVVHVLVFNSGGELLLQKRAKDKEIQPGKWDTSVGGHIACGETLEQALERETEEELGISGADMVKLYEYVMVSEVEKEYVTTFKCIWDGPISYQKSEIDDIRFFAPEEIEFLVGTGFFTPNFEQEWEYYKSLTVG